MFIKRPSIADVFTPRNSIVNDSIYVSRPALEKDLKRSLDGTLHGLIFGNSGTGKSWLYKRVLNEMDAVVAIANCANASRFGSISAEIAYTILPEDRKELESIEEEMSASISAVVANGALKSKRKFKYAAKDPILASFFQLRKLAGSRKAVLVIDNLETIISSDAFMEELGNIIILCDDSRYSIYDIKLLLVGVPSCILEYFARLKNLSTVSNRVNELHEVSCFTSSQVSALVENGFNHLLRLKIPKNILDEWKTHIYEITLGNPQRVHEYCEVLAYALEDNSGIPAADLTIKADENWIRKGLRESYSVVASLMNERETEKGRKNKVLYTLGKITTHCFSSKQLSEKLRKEFPDSTIGVTLNINKILSDLAVRTPSIIKKGSNGSNFEFTDPRYLMVLRTILKKHRDGTVHKLAFKI